MNEPDWRQRARCRDVDPELFHPVGTTGPAADQIKAAKAICALCPVKSECLTFAVTAPWKVQGIWGGVLLADHMSREDKQSLRKRLGMSA